jgi:hypothetical protein
LKLLDPMLIVSLHLLLFELYQQFSKLGALWNFFDCELRSTQRVVQSTNLIWGL